MRGALVLMLSLPSLGASTRPPLAFGDARGWVVVSTDGRVLKQMSSVCGAHPEELAVSPDLRTTAFTAWSEEAQNTLLYACDGDSEKRRLLSEPLGFHAQPSFSIDGGWVFFGHHPRKGGPPGVHEPGANAQLYRVRRDGTGLEALTESKGCKLSPRQVDDDLLVLLHLTCIGPRTVELIRLSDRRVVRTLAESVLSHQPDLSPDGRRLLFTEQANDKVTLIELNVESQRSRVLWVLPAGYENTRARWLGDGSGVLFQQSGAVWRLSVGAKPGAQKLVEWGSSK